MLFLADFNVVFRCFHFNTLFVKRNTFFIFCEKQPELYCFSQRFELYYTVLRIFIFRKGILIMLNEKVAELLNTQINKEFYSAYLYLAFANYFSDEGLDGFANWYNVQAQEERDHAMLIRQYMQNNDAPITFEAIDKPDSEFKSHMEVLEAGLKHERYVTGLINNIYGAAYDVKDFRTMQFLDWFVKEQGEEETNANDLIKKMNLFGSDPKSLYLLDQELAARTYAAPSLVL